MLWAIDVGNTQTVVGIYDGDRWRATWRVQTDRERTEDELIATLRTLCDHAGVAFVADGLVVCSVVPSTDIVWERFAARGLSVAARFLRTGDQVGVVVDYNPPQAVGADRIANALAALERFKTACIVVDFGTATTFDTVDHRGHYVGGAIHPGPMVALESLAGRTAKLPLFALETPPHAIGTDTVSSLQSGFMFGYAGAIDAVTKRIKAELQGPVKVVSTGGLGNLFLSLCEEVEEHDPLLTLEGLRLAWDRALRI